MLLPAAASFLRYAFKSWIVDFNDEGIELELACSDFTTAFAFAGCTAVVGFCKAVAMLAAAAQKPAGGCSAACAIPAVAIAPTPSVRRGARAMTATQRRMHLSRSLRM